MADRLKIPAGLAAYTAGSLAGALAILLESLTTGAHVTAEGLAAYSLAGGLASALARVLGGLVFPLWAARAGGVLVISGFLSINLLYYANVHLLPGEHFLSATSLLVDVAITVTVGLVLWALLSRFRKLTEPDVWRHQLARLAVVAFSAQALVLVLRWPNHPMPTASQSRGPDLILIVVDSARRDHLGLYGYSLPTSPHLVQIGAQGRVFTQAFSASSWTVPSVNGILWSDVSPRYEGLSLAGQLASHGYATACFTNNPHLTADSPILGGFERVDGSAGSWRYPLRKTILGAVAERLAPPDDRSLVDAAFGWASSVNGSFFLYVHLMDAHTPYRRPPIDGRRRTGRRVEFPFTGLRMSAEEAEDVVARYDGGLASADGQVGRLLAAIKARGRPFLAVVTADHGESLGEAGRWFHGGSLAPELLRVPLVLVGDAISPGRVDAPVDQFSLRPTLLAAAGIPCPRCGGVDLLAAPGDGVARGALPPSLVYRVAAGYKLILDQQSGHASLFDLAQDPGETVDLAKRRPQVVEVLSKDLAVPTRAGAPSADDLARIQSLGYLAF